jgi:DNA-binding NtrC family response regulator
MNCSSVGNWNFIRVSVVDEIIQALVENRPCFLEGDEIQFDVVLEALQSGYPLEDIKQEVINQLEKRILTQVIIATKGNKAAAARILCLDYKTLYRKIRKYVIDL